MSASDRVIEAARNVVLGKVSSLSNGNYIEMEDGEKGYIVHSDQMFCLESALENYDKQKAAFKATKA